MEHGFLSIRTLRYPSVCDGIAPFSLGAGEYPEGEDLGAGEPYWTSTIWQQLNTRSMGTSIRIWGYLRRTTQLYLNVNRGLTGIF